jgi:hypothetical protein
MTHVEVLKVALKRLIPIIGVYVVGGIEIGKLELRN